MSTPDPNMGRVLALAPEGSRDAFSCAADMAAMEVVHATSLPDLLSQLQQGPYAATLVTLGDDLVDEAILKRIGESRECGILLLSTPAISLDQALLMERAGAVAILREPFDQEELAERLSSVGDEGADVPVPGHEDPPDGRPEIIGSSPSMAGLFETVARISPSPSTVLITGESGTGKEVVAKTIHWASDRRGGPFVGVNCAAIPEHLLESELFGHEKGSFTGAIGKRRGRFERAHGGTLFLDEIGDMSLVLQAKILRALEDRSLERVGSEKAMPVDVRVVAATNQELPRRIREGLFREDLYFRLAVVELHLPPLRERVEDIRDLTLHFTGVFAERYGRPVSFVTERALERLAAYEWPGNVRELRNVLDRGVLLAGGSSLRSSDLRLGAGSPRTSPSPGNVLNGGYPSDMSLAEVEADHIERVLRSFHGHMGKAASALGIHRNTLTRKVQDYGLSPDALSEEAS